MVERLSYTHEAQVDAVVDYLAQLSYLKNIIRIDVDGVLKPIFETDKENFPIIIREGLFRLISEKYKPEYAELSKDEIDNEVWNIVYDYHVILETKNVKKMQNIRLNSGVQVFDVMILGVNEREGFNRKPLFICDKGCCIFKECGADREIPKVDKCFTHNLEMKIDSKNSQSDFIQRIVIQEQLTDAKNISPIDYDARIIGDMVGDVFIGQKKRVMVAPRVLSKNNRVQSIEQKLLFDVISIADLEEEKHLMPSNKEIEEYRKLAESPDFFDKIISSFGSNFVGNELLPVKKGLFLALIGGTSVDNSRADINVFMCGDPSVAKSSLLLECQSISQKSIFTSGKGSSAAGLTIGMVKRPDGTMIPQAGILPLCDKGIALIDEFDKMDDFDRAGMHQAMEQQTVSIAKAGISVTLPARATVIAAANPKFGRWDEYLTIMENINLPYALVSRFDLRFRILDIPDEISDSKKAAHSLAKTSGVKSTLFSRLQLLSLINHARTLKPRVSTEADDMLQKFYVMLRKKDTKDLRIDLRSLESIKRLSIAHAKLHFKDYVDTQDINFAIDLYKQSLLSFGINIDDTGEQTQLLGNKREHNQHDLFWEVFAKCMDENQTVSKSDMLELMSETKLFTKESAKVFFDKMCKGINQQLLEDVRGRFRRIE